jgi:hypothetical protein
MTITGQDISRASVLTEGVSKAVDDMFEYHAWTKEQSDAGKMVRDILCEATKVIIATVPPSADRSAAIRKIKEARMDCNSAITHDGKY